MSRPGQFQVGSAGNPRGRPPGSFRLVTQLKELYGKHHEDFVTLFRVTIKDAIAGNNVARKIIFDHCFPKIFNLDDSAIEDAVDRKLQELPLEKIMELKEIIKKLESKNNDEQSGQ